MCSKNKKIVLLDDTIEIVSDERIKKDYILNIEKIKFFKELQKIDEIKIKNSISCSIVRDLLPNYIDKLTERESNTIIEEHLEVCSECKTIYEEMTREVEISQVMTETTKERKARDFLIKQN